jgi:hypothetical protein
LVAAAEEQGIVLRLFGGVAIWHRSSSEVRQLLGRSYGDIDLVAHRRSSRELRALLESLGYEPERVFNATHGARRLLYHAPDRSFHIDVFLDRFEMSHQLDFEARLELEGLTLPAADLLLAKLQVAEINHKDLTDTAMLLLDHELADDDGAALLNASHVSAVCARDWGLYTTCQDNLARLTELIESLRLPQNDRDRLRACAAALAARMEHAPKSLGWRVRARVGRRARWYEVPEEVTR